jgi:hypothetical protein
VTALCQEVSVYKQNCILLAPFSTIEVFLRVFFAFFILMLSQRTVQAQHQQSDSSFLAEAIRYRKSAYQTIIGADARLYNGSAYRETIIRDYDVGHPYFLSPEWRDGSITYEGLRYDNVRLMYDLVNGRILTHQFNTLTKIELILEKTGDFTIEDHLFVYVSEKDSLGKLLRNGFYDQLETGTASLYVQRKKEVLEDLSSGKVVREYIDSNVYYIINGSKVFVIRTKGDLFKALSSKKTEIKAQLSKEKIRFRASKEAALILSVKLYNQL